MAVRLFVGNLAYEVTEPELKELFAAVGPPLSVRMPTDRETGKPRGFAFVEFADAAQATEAVRRFHQQVFKGRALVVNEARPREEGGGARPPAFTPGGLTGPPDRPARPAAPPRTFGPDAPPRGKRKPKGYGAKGERGPKGPIRERGGGQFFAGGVDETEGESGGEDDRAFWDRTPETDDDK